MKDINKVEAFNQMNVSRQLIHERKQRIAEFWWKHWALRKVTKAAKKANMRSMFFLPSVVPLKSVTLLVVKDFAIKPAV